MRARGFTLIELLVVLAILGALLAMLPTGLGAALPGLRFHAAARELALALRAARVQAVVGGSARSVALDGAGLPSGTTLALDRRAGSDAPPVVRFYPDGSSSGAVIRLVQGSRAYRIEVDWLTGRVSLDD